MAGGTTFDSRHSTVGSWSSPRCRPSAVVPRGCCSSAVVPRGCCSSAVVPRGCCSSAVVPHGCRRPPAVGRRLSNVVASIFAALSLAGRRLSFPPAVGRRLSKVVAIILAFLASSAFAEALASVASAEGAYTNHAGNVVSGVVVALDARTTTISNATEALTLPLSIFPTNEQRRIAADFGQPRVPVAVKRAIAGADYLDKQVKEGTITPAERKALGR